MMRRGVPGSNQYVTRPGNRDEPIRRTHQALIAAVEPEDWEPEKVAYLLGGGDVTREDLSGDVPVWLLDLAAEHPEPRIRAQVVHNPTAAPSTVTRLATDPIMQIADRAARHPNLPPDVPCLDRDYVVERYDPHLRRLVVAAHTNDPGVAATIAVTVKTWPTRDQIVHRTGTPAVVVQCRTGVTQPRWDEHPVVIVTTPTRAVPDDSEPFTVSPGVYLADDVDPTAAVCVTVGDRWGWIDIEDIGAPCAECHGYGSYNLSSNPDDPEIDRCGCCGGLGRTFSAADRDGVAVTAPSHGSDVWWPTTVDV